ncbi:hypothetical protein GQ457_02G019400 [Hibiscus cannabinus]
MPPKFKTPEFEKFDGTTCPSAHLTMYCRKMALYLDNEKLLIHCFQDSLVGSAARWYTQLSRTHIRTWRDFSRAFLEQYKHITDMVPGRTALQSMEQKTNESFRQYAQRWREVAAQVQPPLLENEVTLLFVNTLKDDFYDRMLDHATKPFADMVMTGELIQAAIKSGRIKGGSESRKHFKKRDNDVNTTSAYAPGYSTGIIIGQPNHPAAPVASTQSSSKQETHSKRERKEKPTFTPIPMRYGHHIDNCTAFKHVVEHLLKMGMLSFETQEKNPLPNHQSVNAVIEENGPKAKEKLSEVITPLKWVWEKLVENRVLKRQDVVTRITSEAICEFHGEAGHVIQEYQKNEDICASEDSPMQRGFSGCKPLIIKLSPKNVESAPLTAPRVVIKAPAPFPYKDSRQVPWKYNCEVSEPVKTDETEENVNEVGNFTRSGSCLLGRPWIHAAGAVPSTLHQKLKFVIDGKLVTIKAEEDIIASISSDTPYIEVDEDAVECTFRSLELVNATFVEENKRMTQFRLSRCAKMQVRQTYGKGAQIGKGFGRRLQGRLYPVFVKAKFDRFGLGYYPDRRGRRDAIRKNQEKRKARFTGEDLPWVEMVFPPLPQVFTPGGLLDPTKAREEKDPFDPNFNRTISEKNSESLKFSDEDLNTHVGNLTVNALMDDEGENYYLERICPCLPEYELNNWTVEELPIIFKSNTE